MIAEPAGIASARSARRIQPGEKEDPFGDSVYTAEPEVPAERLGVPPGTDDHPQPGGPEEAYVAQVETDPRRVGQRLDQGGVCQRGGVQIELALDAAPPLRTAFAGFGGPHAARDGGDERAVPPGDGGDRRPRKGAAAP